MNSLKEKTFEDLLLLNGFLASECGESFSQYRLTNLEIKNFISNLPVLGSDDLDKLDLAFEQYRGYSAQYVKPFTHIVEKDGVRVRFTACRGENEGYVRKLAVWPSNFSLNNINNVVAEIRNGCALKVTGLSKLGSCLVLSEADFYHERPSYFRYPELKGCSASVCVEDVRVYDKKTTAEIESTLSERAERELRPINGMFYADRFLSNLNGQFEPASSGAVYATRIRTSNCDNMFTVLSLEDSKAKSEPVVFTPQEESGSLVDFTSRIGNMSARRMIKELGRKA